MVRYSLRWRSCAPTRTCPRSCRELQGSEGNLRRLSRGPGAAREARAVGLRRRTGPRLIQALQLLGGPDTHLRGGATLRAERGRGVGYRPQGDVRLRGQGRKGVGASSRGYCRGGALLRGARALQDSPAPEAVLRGTDVPIRATTEGPLQAAH